MDTHPKNRLHVLIVPKYHGKFLQDIPDQYLTDILPISKRFATILTNKASTTDNEEKFPFRILQNNGIKAGQEVEHVHFHFIPIGPVKLGQHADSTDKKVITQELEEFQHYIKNELSGGDRNWDILVLCSSVFKYNRIVLELFIFLFII